MTINERVSAETLDKIIEAADEVITALAGTNEDVHKDDSTKMCQLWDDLNDRHATPAIVKAMARELQQYRDAEPVMYVMADGDDFDTEATSTCKSVVDEWVDEWNQTYPDEPQYRTVPLYSHAAHHVTSEECEEIPLPEIECGICGFKSTDADGAHYCCEDNGND